MLAETNKKKRKKALYPRIVNSGTVTVVYKKKKAPHLASEIENHANRTGTIFPERKEKRKSNNNNNTCRQSRMKKKKKNRREPHKEWKLRLKGEGRRGERHQADATVWMQGGTLIFRAFVRSFVKIHEAASQPQPKKKVQLGAIWPRSLTYSRGARAFLFSRVIESFFFHINWMKHIQSFAVVMEDVVCYGNFRLV